MAHYEMIEDNVFKINFKKLKQSFKKAILPVFEDAYGNGITNYDNKSFDSYIAWAEHAGIDYLDFCEPVGYEFAEQAIYVKKDK